MDEVRRFLRYTLPGLSAVIQLLIGLSITEYGIVCKILSAKDLTQNIGIILTIFIASGGLGYLFANIYFSLYWSRPFSSLIAINHLTILANLRKKYIEIVDFDEKPFTRELTKRDAWTILTQYWHSKIENNKKIKGINTVTDRLTDVTHGLGATVIGSIFALMTWIGVHLSILPNLTLTSCGEFLFVFIGWALLIFLLGSAYRRTNLALQSIANTTFTDIVHGEYKAPDKTKIYYHE